MKTINIGLAAAVLSLTSSIACADLLGGEDDVYIGFQVTVPLAVSRGKLMSGKKQYSALFVSQRDGIREGIVFTRDTDGNKALGYLKPSRTYRISQSRIADYSLPIVNLDSDNNVQSNFGVVKGAAYLAIGVVAVGALLDKVLQETVNCVDPDVDSEEIAGC